MTAHETFITDIDYRIQTRDYRSVAGWYLADILSADLGKNQMETSTLIADVFCGEHLRDITNAQRPDCPDS